MLAPRCPFCCAGKSAVGLLSYLACAAQRLPVVYFPRAGDWVEAARAGKGDAFFLRTLLKQNAGECSTAALVVTIKLLPLPAKSTALTLISHAHTQPSVLFFFPLLQTLSWETPN